MKPKIVCAGTFDILHTGHISYLQEAKSLIEGSELIVIVARDINSERIKNKKTINDEIKRLNSVSKLPFVGKAVLGNKGTDLIKSIADLKPDLIALGHDQWARKDWLINELKDKGLNTKIVRIKKYTKIII